MLFSFRPWPVVAGLLALAAAAGAEPQYALGLYGPEDVKRGPDAAFPYVNPAAPKGGSLVMRAGPFTKLNPYSLKGLPAPLVDLVFESGAKASAADDEPFTVYGQLWESMDLAAEWAATRLSRPVHNALVIAYTVSFETPSWVTR